MWLSDSNTERADTRPSRNIKRPNYLCDYIWGDSTRIRTRTRIFLDFLNQFCSYNSAHSQWDTRHRLASAAYKYVSRNEMNIWEISTINFPLLFLLRIRIVVPNTEIVANKVCNCELLVGVSRNFTVQKIIKYFYINWYIFFYQGRNYWKLY